MISWSWDSRVFINPEIAAVQQAAVMLLAGTTSVLALLIAVRWLPLGGVRAGRVVACTIVATALLLGCWNWPVADDWAWASLSRDSGAGGAIAASYLGWTGRFGSYALQCWYGAWCGPVAGSVVWSWLIIVGMVLSAWYACAATLSRRMSLAVAVTGVACWIVAMEWPAHGLYWFSATATYAIAIPGLLLLLGLVGRMHQAGIGRWLMLCILSAWMGGIGESMSAALTGLAGVAVIRAWLVGSPARWPWLAACIGLACGICVNALAPGTSGRMEAIEATVGDFGGAVRLDTADLLVTWLSRSLLACVSWLTHPVVVIAGVASVPIAIVLARRMAWDAARGWEVLVIWVMVPVTAMAAYLPSMVTLGHAPPWRGRDATQGLMLVVAWIALVRTCGWLRGRGLQPLSTVAWLGTGLLLTGAVVLIADRGLGYGLLGPLSMAGLGIVLMLCRVRGRSSLRPAAGWLLAVVLVLGGTAPALVLDAACYGPRWRAFQEAQAAELAGGSADATSHVIRPPPQEVPHHLWNYGPGDKPQAWINRAIATWYGVGSVATWPGPPISP